MRHAILAALFLTTSIVPAAVRADETVGQSTEPFLHWQQLPDLPEALGLGGPVVGVHGDALIVAGGANFPVGQAEDLWDVAKVWHDAAYVLVRAESDSYRWLDGFSLETPVAYAACVNTPWGVACLGGSDGKRALSDCFLLQWDAKEKSLQKIPLPPLPGPCIYGAAAMIDGAIYLAGGQSGMELPSATNSFRRLDLGSLEEHDTKAVWQTLPDCPGPARAFNLTVAQHNGFNDCIYVLSGRRQTDGVEGTDGIDFLTDVYEFDPTRYRVDGDSRPWRRRADVPRCVMAGTAAPVGQSHVFVLSGADGSLMSRADELKDRHPGFPRRALAYHTITDTWIDAGQIPANQVTTPATTWGDAIIVATGEVRPRVRTPAVWAVTPVEKSVSCGPLNFSVLAAYLLAMVGVGVYFARKNKDTDDYFRGGKKIVWWAAGCSIFATMLSSITFMAIPAKAYAQDIVYLLGNLMIFAVAPLIVFLVLPFFRRIDATSAYEYLELRFNRPVRLFASGLFSLFQVFRMAIVMSLAALALTTITPLSAGQCVLIMGALSILYSTLGGVEAVIWTDTIQTVVLLGGALLCFGLMIIGAEEGLGTLLQTSIDAGKLRWVNLHWDPSSASLAAWVVVLGALGQNGSSYTSDQAVV